MGSAWLTAGTANSNAAQLPRDEAANQPYDHLLADLAAHHQPPEQALNGANQVPKP